MTALANGIRNFYFHPFGICIDQDEKYVPLKEFGEVLYKCGSMETKAIPMDVLGVQKSSELFFVKFNLYHM